MPATTVAGDVVSSTWNGATPEITVVVSTFGRPQFLAGLVAALEKQTLEKGRFEAVLVDNGSGDETWERLTALVESCSIRARAVRVRENRGPGGGRNVGFASSRAPLVAVTDDDCLPSATWLERLVAAFVAGADVIQGTVEPDPDGTDARRWWDHTVTIHGPTPWFETSNVAYRRSYLDLVGGFDETDPLTAQHGGGRAFGEDAVLGARVVAAGAQRRWVEDAVVYHRIVPSTYRHQLREWRNLRGFPGLVLRSQVGTDSLYGGVFLNKEMAQFDLALAGLAVALATRRAWPLLAVLPWAKNRWRSIRSRTDTDAEAVLRLVQRGMVEAVGLASLVEGSIQHRRLVL